MNSTGSKACLKYIFEYFFLIVVIFTNLFVTILIENLHQFLDRFFLGTAIFKLKVWLMYKKYQFPLNIFIVFEKITPIIYTSDVLTPNHYVCFIPLKWFYGINQFLKNELFYNFSTLMEISAIDTLKYSKILPKIDTILVDNRFFVFNIYYLYLTKIRLTFILNSNGTNNITSIENLYKNANWLERETSEMFGINYTLKKDQRILLLDYSKSENPLLKDFPTEGYMDIYYNFFENQLSYIQHEFIEL